MTIVNTITPAAMPLSEFVGWRARRYPDEQHVAISQAVVPDAAMRELAELPNVLLLPGSARIRPFLRRVRRTLTELNAGHSRIVVHLHYPRSGIWFHAARLGLPFPVPVLFTIHSSFARYRTATQVISGMNCVLADHVTFVSQAAAGEFPRSLRRLGRARYSVVRNGVDLDRVDAALANSGTAPEPGGCQPGGAFRLVHVGRFRSTTKGQAFLLDVLHRVPDVTASLVGDGPGRVLLEERVRREGLADRVRFTGLLSREEVYREIDSADLFVSPSVREGMPIAVLEAMAVSKPVLLSDIPPHREIRRENPQVTLAPLDVTAWTEAIRRHALRPAEELRRDGRSNRETVERAFSLETMHEAYTRLYEQLLRSGQGIVRERYPGGADRS